MLAALYISHPSKGCDVCGCSASNQYLGILPEYNYNFISLQYEYNGFTSSHPSLYEGRPYENAKDYYHTLQLWGRYNIGKRYQVFAFVPYHSNAEKADSNNSSNSGIGDVSVLVNRVFIKTDTGKWQHQLLAGGGIKAPTGKYTGISTLDKLGLPNMQPGTGSWDFILNANYTVRRGKSGANIDAAYTFTTPNGDNFKYGNRLNVGALAFHSMQAKSFSIVPQAGLRYEYALHDYDNYSKKWLNEQSGGYILYAAAGVQAYYKKLGLRVTYQLPVSQDYSGGYVTAKQKFETGVFLLF